MKILLIHNRYQEAGGEDSVVFSEKKLLERKGHQVVYYERTNKTIQDSSFFKKISFVFNDVLWSRATYNEVREMIQKEKPDVAHIHNIFLVISPSVYDACYAENLPVVQTFHNYRLMCASGVFFRDGKVCEECLTGSNMPAVKYRCWRKSLLLSAMVSQVQTQIQVKKYFFDKVNYAVVPSKFSKQKFMTAGLPEDKIIVKPNFAEIEDKQELIKLDAYALFVGRLADYKGIDLLLDAFDICQHLYLRIIGDGPLQSYVKNRIQKKKNIQWCGRKSYVETLQMIKMASCVVFPSICYETFGKVVIESFACRTPVIVSDHGAAAELVEDGKTGFRFKMGNAEHLAELTSYLMSNKEQTKVMGQNARLVYEQKYSGDRNYDQLMQIYDQAVNAER